MNKILRSTVFAPVLIASVACGSADRADDSQSSSAHNDVARPVPAQSETANEPVYTRTIVVRDARGTEEVKQSQITASAQRAELEAARADRQARLEGKPRVESVTQDSCTDGAAMWLYHGPNLSGNESCFYDTGNPATSSYVDLALYTEQCNTISGHVWCTYWYDGIAGNEVGSFYAGSQQGCFNNSTSASSGDYFVNFGAYQQVMSTSSFYSNFTNTEYLWLVNSCTFLR